MIRAIALLPLLLASCAAPAGVAAMTLGLTVADKALGVTDSVVALVKQPAPVAPACPAPTTVGWALNGDRQ